MSEVVGAQTFSFASRLTALRNGLFQALIVMQKRGAHGHGAMSIAGLIIKWLQMMAFLFISNDFDWDKNVIAPIRVLSLVPSPAGWFKVLSPTFVNVLFFISFIWVLFFCCLMIWTVRNFLRGRIPSLAPLKVLASIGQFSATVAYIPLMTLLLSVYMCNNVQEGMADQWQTGYDCMKGGHLALVVLSTVFATVFVGLAALFAIVFYDNHPLSSNLASKIHGRAEIIMLLVKTILILTIEIFPNQLGNVWALIGINIVAAATWVAVILFYMPMMHHGMNALHMALGCLYLWGGLCLAIDTAAPWVNGAVILYVGAPLAAIVGVALAHLRRKSVLGRVASKLSNVYEVEMKARYTLQYALASLLEQSTSAATRSETAGLLDNDEMSVVPPPGGAVVGTGVTPRGPGTARFDLTSPRSLVQDVKSLGNKKSARDSRSRRSAAEETDFAIFAASYRALDAESRERMIRDRLPIRVLNECEALFKHGVMRFPTSAILHMFESQFYSVFKHDRHLATSHLLLANRLSPALDVAYLSFQARRAAETASGSGVLSSAMHRLSFDKHLADAKVSTLKAAQAQVSFWQELCDTKPDINLLHSIAADLATHTSLAEAHFKEVFTLHPQSLSAMRLFAQYNMSVVNNPEKASAISAEADRIEDQKNKEQNASGGSTTATGGFPFVEEVPMENMTDAVAQLTVGATSRDLGVILSANSAACRILGYTRLQLERRNVSVVVPPPFFDNHDSYMRRYLSTGEGRFIESARNVLGKHRLGHLVPFTILLRETTLSDNTPVFNASLRPLNFNDHVVMMDEDWVVLGATAGALLALQVEAATLSASEVCMADYCPMLNDSESVTDLMGRAQGDVVQMRLPGFAQQDPGSKEGVSASAPGSVDKDSQARRGRADSVPKLSMGDVVDAAMSNGLHQGRTVSAKVDPWSKPVDVKATLASHNLKGYSINIFTFRMLSANESAQRANAAASRRASLAAGEGGMLGLARKSFMSTLKSRNALQRPASEYSVARQVATDSDGSDEGSEAEYRKGGSSLQDGDGRGEDDEDSLEQKAEGEEEGSRGSVRRDADPQRWEGSTGTGLPDGHPRITAAAFGATCPVIGTGGRISPMAPPQVSTALMVSAVSGTVKKKKSLRINQEASVEVYERPESGRRGSVSSAAPGQPDMEGEKKHGTAFTKNPVGPESYGRERRQSVGGDGRGSVRSGGSSSKRSSIGRTTLNKLRRIIATATQGTGAMKGVPGLSLLNLAGWLLLILNLGLGILTAALLDSNFVNYARNLRFASIAGVTTHSQLRGMRLIADRINQNNAWMPVTPQRSLIDSREMSTTADLFSDSTSRMYNLVVGTERETFFTSPTLTYMDFTDAVPEPPGKVGEAVIKAMLLGDKFWPWSMSDGSVMVGVRRKVSMLDFAAMWSGILKQVSNLPAANVTGDHPWAIFLLVNTQAGAPAHEFIKRAIYESFLASEDSQKIVTTLVLWIFVAMGPIIGAVLLTIVIPILLYIDFKRDEIMEAFLDLPHLIVMYLRASAERRLRALRSDDEDGESGDDDDEEEDARRALQLGIDGDNPDLELEDGTVDWEAVFARVAVEASRAEKKRMKKLMGDKPATVVTTTGASGEEKPGEGSGPASSKPAAAQKSTDCCGRARASKKSVVHTRSLCSRGVRSSSGGYYRSVVNPDGSVSTFVRRDFVKSSKSFISLAVFLVPVLLMFMFYLILYLVTMGTVDRVIAMSAFTSLSAMRGAAIRASLISVMYQVSTPGYDAEDAFRFEYASQQIVNLVSTNKLLVYDVRVEAQAGVDGGIGPPLQYKKSKGTESSTVPGVPQETMDTIRRVQDSDACPWLSTLRFNVVSSMGRQSAFDLNACRTVNGGALTSGLQAAVRDFLRRARRLRDRRWNTDLAVNTTDGVGVLAIRTSSEWANFFEGTEVDASDSGLNNIPPGGTYIGRASGAGTATGTGSTSDPSQAQTTVVQGVNSTLTTYMRYSVREELQSEDFTTLNILAREYLIPAFTAISDIYGTTGEQIVTDYRVFLMAFVGGFLALYVLGTLFMYLPAIGTVAKDVQSKRAMLLLLPAQVIAQLPSLRAMVLQIVSEAEGGSASSSGRRSSKGSTDGDAEQATADAAEDGGGDAAV